MSAITDLIEDNSHTWDGHMVIYIFGRSRKVTSEHIKRKILLLGDEKVGKTSLIRKFVLDKFDDKYITTVGSKVTKKELELKSEDKNICLTLMIWDVLGQKGYRSVQSSSFKGADGVILVCDFTRGKTLQSLKEYWLPSIDDKLSNPRLVFVANKSDLIEDAQFSFGELQKMASKYSSVCFSSSAKTGENVENLFLSLGRMLVDVEKGEESKEFAAVEVPPENMTLVGAADWIISDFCNSFGDREWAMSIIRQQFTNAEVDIRRPTKEGLLKVIGGLVDVERDFKDESTVKENRMKRSLIVEQAES